MIVAQGGRDICCGNNQFIGCPVITERLNALMDSFTNTTVLGNLLEPLYLDALRSKLRAEILVAETLLSKARALLSDRLSEFGELGGRPVYATDDTCHKESTHYTRRTPGQGGKDTPAGHVFLSSCTPPRSAARRCGGSNAVFINQPRGRSMRGWTLVQQDFRIARDCCRAEARPTGGPVASYGLCPWCVRDGYRMPSILFNDKNGSEPLLRRPSV